MRLVMLNKLILIYKPLIQETANKIQHMSPYLAQTGPGIRNDKKTIKKHLKLIEKPLYKDLYELLTKSIKNTHGIKAIKILKQITTFIFDVDGVA